MSVSAIVLSLRTVSKGLSAAVLMGLLISGTSSCPKVQSSSLVKLFRSCVLTIELLAELAPSPARLRKAGLGSARPFPNEKDNPSEDSWDTIEGIVVAGGRAVAIVIAKLGCLLEGGAVREDGVGDMDCALRTLSTGDRVARALMF